MGPKFTAARAVSLVIGDEVGGTCTGPKVWPSEEKEMIRAEGEKMLGVWESKRLLRRKCPRWLMPNWDSIPSGVGAKFARAMTPALLMMMSILREGRAMMEAAAERIDAKEVRSSVMNLVMVVGERAWTIGLSDG